MDTLSKILFLIKLRGLNDIEFTNQTGLYKTILAEWKSGKTKSYLNHLPNIASTLNVSEDFLLNDSMTFISDTNIKLDEDIQKLLIRINSLSEKNIDYLNQTLDLLLSKQELDNLKNNTL